MQQVAINCLRMEGGAQPQHRMAWGGMEWPITGAGRSATKILVARETKTSFDISISYEEFHYLQTHLCIFSSQETSIFSRQVSRLKTMRILFQSVSKGLAYLLE